MRTWYLGCTVAPFNICGVIICTYDIVLCTTLLNHFICFVLCQRWRIKDEQSIKKNWYQKFTILWNSLEPARNSIKFRGIPWNLLGHKESSIEFLKIPWNLAFHGIPKQMWQVPWNSMELWKLQLFIKLDIAEFHGIPWKFINSQFSLASGSLWLPWNIPWDSMELLGRQIRCHQVPWNSMELGGC